MRRAVLISLCAIFCVFGAVSARTVLRTIGYLANVLEYVVTRLPPCGSERSLKLQRVELDSSGCEKTPTLECLARSRSISPRPSFVHLILQRKKLKTVF